MITIFGYTFGKKAPEPHLIKLKFDITGDKFVVFVDGIVDSTGNFKAEVLKDSPFNLVDRTLKQKYSVWLSDYTKTDHKALLLMKKPFSTTLVMTPNIHLNIEVNYL